MDAGLALRAQMVCATKPPEPAMFWRELLSAGFSFGFVFLLLALIVMPLDGEEHAGAEDESLERDEDYRNPIDHFENFQPMT